jgi:hypothetical protein
MGCFRSSEETTPFWHRDEQPACCSFLNPHHLAGSACPIVRREEMHSYRIVWEDEAKAREIELFVHYRLDAGVVAIDAVRPAQVTLYNSSTKQPIRTLLVHTATARRLLADAYLASRETEQSLEEEILAAHALLDDEVGAAV